MASTTSAEAFESWRRRVDAVLQRALPAAGDPPRRLHAAMRHAVLLGGKRMRPLLVYAAGNALGVGDDALNAPAAAVELIHAYSLVHDDLPAMDDDALRRGQPTVHVAFDEATAILAGDALQALAFAVLAAAPTEARRQVAMLAELAAAAGTHGMCGGQALDIEATGAGRESNRKGGRSEVSRARLQAHDGRGREIHSDPLSPDPFSLAGLERLHALKTGALLRASVRLGAIAADANASAHACLDRYAEALGLAFQIRDDLLDIEGDSATLGKTSGKDAAQGKLTFPALIGIEASRARLQALATEMQDALRPLGPAATHLLALGQHAVERSH